MFTGGRDRRWLGLLTGWFVYCSFGQGTVSAGKPSDSELPVIPVGLDAFRMWDRWAYFRIGQRTYMASTYDRAGNNETADASHFLYQLGKDRNVTMDVMGQGVLAFARYNHWHGSPWHYVIDGRDNVVRESSTADPNNPVPESVFIPERQFPNPLTWTWSITKGADLMWVPLPFERSFTMAYERTHYGTGYYIYHLFMPGIEHLSRPIRGWTMDDIPGDDVLDLIRRSGTDIAPTGDGVTVLENRINLPARGAVTVADISAAPATIRALKFDISRDQAPAFGDARIRIHWDDRAHASVDAPIKLFFGTGSLYNRDDKEYLVRAFPVNIRFSAERVHFEMYFPMPFMKRAKIELVQDGGSAVADIATHIRHMPYTDPPHWVGHFHATYVDHGEPTPGEDLVFLDTREVEGGGDWCGHFVGTSWIFTDRAYLPTLEGDPRFYFDDALTPHAQGTGTEEWGGGGDYWGGRTMSLPFAGHPVGCGSPQAARNEEDKIHSAYRFLLSDLMPFGRNARITFEHGGVNESEEHYRSVTYWYGLNRPCLVVTDTFNVGDPEDERRHQYDSPTASDVQPLTTRYEWGPDQLHGKEIFPPSTDIGRNMTGVTTFTVKLRPDNLGAMLRRKFDYQFPNQCAKVYVADVDPDAPWHEVGTWYTAGSNTCIFSNPPGELGETLHNVQTSNRRWRESEFLLPRQLTEGREAVRVKIEFTPRSIPLFPGHPLAEEAWSEYRYTTYCYVMPSE